MRPPHFSVSSERNAPTAHGCESLGPRGQGSAVQTHAEKEGCGQHARQRLVVVDPTCANVLPCVAFASCRRCGFTRSRSKLATMGSRPSSCSMHADRSRPLAPPTGPATLSASRTLGRSARKNGTRCARRRHAAMLRPWALPILCAALPLPCSAAHLARHAPGRGPACFRRSIAGRRRHGGPGRSRSRPWCSAVAGLHCAGRFSQLLVRLSCTPSLTAAGGTCLSSPSWRR